MGEASGITGPVRSRGVGLSSSSRVCLTRFLVASCEQVRNIASWSNQAMFRTRPLGSPRPIRFNACPNAVPCARDLVDVVVPRSYLACLVERGELEHAGAGNMACPSARRLHDEVNESARKTSAPRFERPRDAR
jgi:hypothetical protein